MNIVFTKNTKEIVWQNPHPEPLDGRTAWSGFNGKNHAVAFCPRGLPMSREFDLVDGQAIPWTDQQRYDAGLLTRSGMKMVNGEWVEKTEAERLAAGEITQADIDARIARDAAEAAYAYARKRAAAYVAAYSKDPQRNAVDAIGHVLDAIIDAVYGDTTALDAIKASRDRIKQDNPK